MALSEPQHYVEVWENTISHYDARVEQNPGDVRNLTMLGWSCERAGRYQEAVEHFEQAVKLDSDSTDAQYGLGLALLGAGRWQEALQAFERAHTLAEDSVDRGYTVVVQHHCQALFRRYRSAS